ncbi:MAG TPA: helix-turn-helix transcriptional regulator [Pseudonocardiaceae bacterium]|jgi:transcriptional regulator with XRE-family HTH domain
MADTPATFWDDLAEDLQDPEVLRTYVAESIRIETIDRLVNRLDEVREADGLTKAELARAINAEPAVVRRLLSLGHRNPTIGTLVEVAAALGLRVTLEPIPAGELDEITGTLRSGVIVDAHGLVQSMEARRRPAS